MVTILILIFLISSKASPIPGITKSFKGTDIYKVDELPIIDFHQTINLGMNLLKKLPK